MRCATAAAFQKSAHFVLANISEITCLNKLLAVVFAPYLLHIGLRWVPDLWRKLLVASIILIGHALAIIHLVDASLGTALVVICCIGFNLLASLIMSIVASIKRKAVLVWLGLQIGAIVILLVRMFT